MSLMLWVSQAFQIKSTHNPPAVWFWTFIVLKAKLLLWGFIVWLLQYVKVVLSQLAVDTGLILAKLRAQTFRCT